MTALTVVVLVSVAWVSLLAYDVGWAVREASASTVSCCPMIAETPSGELLIAYGTAEGVMLATEDGGDWTTSKVVGSEDPGITYYVRALSLVIGPDGYPRIASISSRSDEPIKTLIYSEQTSSGWENTVIDTEVSHLSVSLAIDSDLNAHISYAKYSDDWGIGENVTYATDSTGSWTAYDITRQLPFKWDEWVSSSIAVDRSGGVHMAFISEYVACYVANLTGTPEYDVVGWGNAAMGGIYPSRPSILVDADDVVHVLCVDERQEVYDGPIARSLVHYTVADGSGDYENTTIISSTDLSWAATEAFIDDRCLRVFYRGADGMGVITLLDDGDVVVDTFHVRDFMTQGHWYTGVSVVHRESGEWVVSKPYGAVGYLSDSFTFSERLYIGTAPVQQYLIMLSAVAVIIAVALVFSRRGLREEAKWRRALEE